MKLRPYQQAALTAILDALARDVRRQLVAHPTGVGKTVIFVALAMTAKRPVLFIAHRDDLLDQITDKLVAAGVDRDKIGKSRANRTNGTDRLSSHQSNHFTGGSIKYRRIASG